MGTIVTFHYELLEWQKIQNIYTANHLMETTPQFFSRSSSPALPSSPAMSTTSSQKTAAVLNNNYIHLNEILQMSELGKNISDLAHTTNELNDRQRQVLVDEIVSYYNQNKLTMTPPICSNLAIEINAVFPNEPAERYYMKRRNMAPSGKLYTKFHYEKKKMKIFPLQINKKFPETSTADKSYETIEYENHVHAIKFDVLTADELTQHWKMSIKPRLDLIAKAQTTDEILQKWPEYKTPTGYRFINIDFSGLHTDSCKLFEECDRFSERILKLYAQKIKDPDNKIILEKLQLNKDISYDGRLSAIFFLLPAMLKNNSSKVTKDSTGKKTVIKYGIKQCQSAFIYLASTTIQVREQIAKLKKNNENVQPFIVVLGEDIFNPTDINVYFDDIIYQFSNIIKAIDICFKIFQLFNLKYPIECLPVWQFLQSYFYKLKFPNDEILASVKVIINKLESSD